MRIIMRNVSDCVFTDWTLLGTAFEPFQRTVLMKHVSAWDQTHLDVLFVLAQANRASVWTFFFFF
eukprot:EC849912.1.p4 GENE.EC849912.1~~EC849912.1.p4  ORF type:complete len:65 (+),score=18.27 EC849912.1:57-251(+)